MCVRDSEYCVYCHGYASEIQNTVFIVMVIYYQIVICLSLFVCLF